MRFGTGAVKTPCWWGEEGAAVLAYFGQVEASQGGVAGGHPGYPQRHDVAHPQHFAQHRAGVGHVLLVLHGGLAALADHGVNFELHFLYRNQTKKKNTKKNYAQKVPNKKAGPQACPTWWTWKQLHFLFQLSVLGLYSDGHIGGPTLNVGVRGHVEQSPADGSRRRLRPSQEEVQGGAEQVFLVEIRACVTLKLG